MHLLINLLTQETATDDKITRGTNYSAFHSVLLKCTYVYVKFLLHSLRNIQYFLYKNNVINCKYLLWGWRIFLAIMTSYLVGNGQLMKSDQSR